MNNHNLNNQNEMKKIQLILLLLAAALASCSGDSFKIDGTLANLDGATVRVVFKADSCIVDESIDVDKKGKFSYQGHSSQPAVITLLNQRGDILTTVVAVNGDHLKVKGDASKGLEIKVKGNRLNEDWQLFRDEHMGFYTDPNHSRLDAAIEKYVREHPADMLSTVLLLVDYSNYSDRDKLGQLLNGINVEARPEALTQLFPGDPLNRKKVNLPRLASLTLWKHGGGFEEVKLTDRVTLLSLWAQPQKDREALKTKIQAFKEKNDGKAHVVDILAESDTIRWYKTIAGEDWPHYWAPGGPLEQGVQLLKITSLPWFAVADSTGLVVYSGPDIDAAIKQAMAK